MKTIIAGSRDITCYKTVEKAIEDSGFEVTEVVSGTCDGVDALGEIWSGKNEVPCKCFPANWPLHGRAAGPIRNGEMAEYADALIAVLWSRGSRGTENMIKQARTRGLKVHEVRV